MSPSEANSIADGIINLSHSEKIIFKFTLPITYIYLEPADMIEILGHRIRITDIKINGLAMEITGIGY